MNNNLPDLRAWRKHRGISLDSISASTKLSIRQLEAIESGDLSKLPGGIYNTSYIRQYARAIEFDEMELLAYYNNDQREEAPPARSNHRTFWQLAR
jgi:cytoskeleton protein RodZ